MGRLSMMRKNKKRLGLAIALTAIATVGAGAFALNVNVASAEEFSIDGFTMMQGASVRYSVSAQTQEERYASSGIRFHAVLPTETYNTLENSETDTVKVSYGMLIAPYAYLTQYGEFNAANVFGVDGDRKYGWEGDMAEDLTQIINITYDDLLACQTEGYTDCHEIKGSILKIKEENYALEFVGRAYVKYEHDGVVEYEFSEYANGDASNSARSAAYVAQLAADKQFDCATWLKENYLDPVTDKETTYTVETYVGDTLVKTETRGNVTIDQALENAAVEEYEGFELVSAETEGKVYANGRLTLKHVYKEEENSAYQVKNGGFETGDLTDWTLQGNIGAVSSETNYWRGDEVNADGFAFGMDGTYMFSAYAIDGLEGNMGTLRSSAFKVSQSGWLTFKLGGAKNNTFVYVDIVEAATGNILKRYSNQNHRYEVVDGFKYGCELNAYKADLRDIVGKEVYVRVSDNASADFGLFFLDEVNALHIAEPNGYTLATEVAHQATIYDLYNGNFDMDMNGWAINGEIGVINECERYWPNDRNLPYNNVGKFFSAYKLDGHSNDGLEWATGTLRSNVFEIGGSGYITYRIGGVKNPDQVYMEVIDAITGVKYGHFYNQNLQDCTLVSYQADLSAYIGKLVYIHFVDNATGDYGLIFADEFKTYYANAADVPADYAVAVNKVESIYNVMNGGFETGNLLGWTLVSGEVPGRVTDINTFWNDANRVIGKDGNFSFTGVELNGDNGNLEYRIGTLRSNTFVLKANSSISFKLGGCRTDNYDVCLRIVNAVTGEVVASYNNPNRNDATLISYTHAINNAQEMACYIELVDNATGDWGLLGVDSINVFQA